MAKTKKAAKRKPGRPAGSVGQFNFNLSATIRQVIEKENRFLHQTEIVKHLLRKAKPEDLKVFKSKTSVLIQAMKKSGKIADFVESDNTRGHYYGKSEWLKRGKPVAAHAPKIA